MPNHASNSPYQQVVTISHTYLGPAAERFIDRQIKNHLDKDPTELNAGDISKLIDWIRIAVSFLTEDSELIEEYIHQLKQVANNTKQDS
jgi:hypothetical protein